MPGAPFAHMEGGCHRASARVWRVAVTAAVQHAASFLWLRIWAGLRQHEILVVSASYTRVN